MDVFMNIGFALMVIASLESYSYPNLNYYNQNSTVFIHMKALLELLQNQTRPVVTVEGKGYFLFSQKHIRQWSRAIASCGGNNERWQSHKVWLKDLGLIDTIVVDGPNENPTLNRIWETARAKKRRPETLWHIPLLSAELLQYADKKAGKYRECHLRIAHLRKSIMIRLYDYRYANWLYSDYRDISAEEKLLLQYCHDAIRGGVATKGYTTFKEVEVCVRALCSGRESYVQRLAELLDPNESANKTLDLLLQDKGFLCYECGCTYRQITKADRDSLSLPENLRSWIITAR